jgi:hypothetical protein
MFLHLICSYYYQLNEIKKVEHQVLDLKMQTIL